MGHVLGRLRQNQSGPSYLQGFGRNKGGRLADFIGQEFLPELDRSRGTRSRVEKSFFPTLDPRAGEEFVTRGAERIASDVLRAGGPITEQIRRARGGAISAGFGTQGGDLSRQESQIVNQGLRDSVGAFIGQSLPGLYEGAAGRSANAFGITQEQSNRLLESAFTGLSGAESLRLANRGNGLLGLGIGPL